MKKVFLLLPFAVSIAITATAQVKIGGPGDPDINAVLELAGSNKGLLLPRLALAGTSDASPLSAHIAGMVVYNTATVSDIRPGYYYNDGIRWIRLASFHDNWSLLGNLATSPASQYVGTADPTDLSIRTAGMERIRIAATGNIEIGTSLLPSSVKLKLGGSVSGDLGALIGLDGTINPTANNQLLYSIRNNPIFGIGFTVQDVVGLSTQFTYAGNVSSQVLGESATVFTAGSNSFPSVVAGVHGFASRNSSGATDGGYYGGYFRAQASGTGAGSVTDIYAVFGNSFLSGSGAVSVSSLGGQFNFINNSNSNATVLAMYGVKNLINHNAPATVNYAYGINNTIAANSGAIFTETYGSLTNFVTNSGGSLGSVFGHYLGSIPASTNLTDYRGIFIANIASGAGARRAFEYAGTGTNDPVIINYDGSVQIGNSIAVANAKLSITDGHLQSGQATKPLIVPTANIGTGGTATLADATDIAGIITLDMGSGAWAAGIIATINFNKLYAVPPIVVITPTNANATFGILNQRPYVTSTTAGFSIIFGAAATNGNAMAFNYYVIETVNN